MSTPMRGTNSGPRKAARPPSNRWLLGGLGGFIPLLLNLLVVDLQTVFTDVTPVVIAGYGLKAILLFGLGGLFAWLHRKESEPLKLVQLGIAAPAMLTALVNGAKLTGKMNNPDGARALFGAIVAPAPLYAAQTEPVCVNQFDKPRESVAAQFWRGLTGGSSNGDWFVTVKGTFPDPYQAIAQAQQVKQNQGLPARVYAPADPSSGFIVVIGDWLTEDQARQVLERAAKAGLPLDTWSLRYHPVNRYAPPAAWAGQMCTQ